MTRMIALWLLAAVSLLPSLSYALTADGAPSISLQSLQSMFSGLTVWRTSGGTWQANLTGGGSKHVQFAGTFGSSQPFASFSTTLIESKDTASLSQPNLIGLKLDVYGGGRDTVSFTLAQGAGVCLRSTSGSEVMVYVGKNLIAATTPIDLTENGACGTTSVPPPPPPVSSSDHPGHYIALMRGNDSQSTMSASIKAGVTGFMKRFTWRALEPTQGNYDFTELASDLNYLAGQGMHLIVMIEDKTFTSENPMPGYLASSPYTLPSKRGYTAVRWNATTVARFKALVTAIGNRFDGHAAFEGIATQESAPGFDDATLNASGYTPEKYRDALIDELTTAARAMPNANVFWFMNFFPRNQDYIGSVATAVAPAGVLMGGPDVLPDDNALVTRTYPFYDQMKGKMSLFGQVEPMCYNHLHADTSYPTKYWTMPELFRYARDNLHTNYMFWVRVPNASPADSYDWNDALPVIANNPSFN